MSVIRATGLVTHADASFPFGMHESEWRLTRSRHSDDVNAEVCEAVDRDGYTLFRIGLPLSEIPESQNVPSRQVLFCAGTGHDVPRFLPIHLRRKSWDEEFCCGCWACLFQ